MDGAVTFHEVGPRLTRVLVVLEYYPQGLFERTGNIWRAQGRRVRLELKHLRRHVMTRTILDEDEIEGWRGEIRDGEVVRTHEDAMAEEEDRDVESDQDQEDYADEDVDEEEDVNEEGDVEEEDDVNEEGEEDEE